MPKTLFILAGEASGDLHGAKLIEALKAADPGIRIVGMGGPKMAAAGLEVFKDLDGMQVVGFWEVAKKYGFFKKVFFELLDRFKQTKPDALICIDYPGFNLRFAKEVHKLGVPILYYIVPQVWAWKPDRARTMSTYIDRAYCVFDFEPPFFQKFANEPGAKMKTVFVGHPILDQPKISEAPEIKLSRDAKIVSVLPGSRQSEIENHLEPACFGIHRARKPGQPIHAIFSISKGTPICRASQAQIMTMTGEHWAFWRNVKTHWAFHPSNESQVSICESEQKEISEAVSIQGSHASLLPALSDFSVVKSGTSTLEAGLQSNPMCVVYKGGWISYGIARLLVDIPVFSLVNIVLGKYAVPELLQSEVNPTRIAAEIERGLTDQKYIETQRAALAELPKKLGGPGASVRTAQAMLGFLNGKE